MRTLLPAAICLFFTTLSVAQDRYDFSVEEDLTGVEFTACFEGQPPARLYRHREASQHTDWIRLGDRAVDTSGSRISLRSLAQNECASWRVNLATAGQSGDYRVGFTVQDAVLTAGNVWFWRDGDKRDIEVTAHLPYGVEFSTPWPETSRLGNTRTYRPAKTSANWTSRLVLGRFPGYALDIGGTEVRLAMVGDFDRAKQVEIQQWIAEPAQGVAEVIGRFPQQQPQVLVVGIGPRSGPVPWAHVIRGGGVAVELFVDESRSLQEFRDDWTATHEFSHLLLPYVSSQDRWLSEGLASYYQNVLRARDGRLTEEEAWKKLNGGFRRGKDDSRRGGNMDTYWRGASILLQADAQLRAQSKGQQSLDSVLADLHECCRDPGRRWLALELFEQLDELTGYDIFVPLYAKHALEPDFPDPEPTLQKLGVISDWRGLVLDDQAPWSQIRHFIMNEPLDRSVANQICTEESCISSD